MLKIEFLSHKDLATFVFKFKKKTIVKENNSIYIAKKDKYLAKRIIKTSSIDGHFEDKKLDRKIIYLNLLIIFIIVAFISISFYIDSMYKIEINCKDFATKSFVENYIKQNEIIVNNDNKKDIKNLILSLKEDIAFVEIEIKNNKVTIRIETMDVEHVDITKRQNIYALESGVITKILLYSGSAKVKVGDVVKKGDLLIAGEILKGDEKINVEAKADVYAKCYIKDSFCIPKKICRKIDTKKKHTIVEVFGIKLNKNCAFKEYRVVQNIITVFPIKIIKTTIFETKEKYIELTKEDVEKIALNEISEKLLQIGRDNRVISYRYDQKYLDNFYHLDIYYEVEQCISIEGG